ncbi:MAG: glycosyltransferase [Synergistaceae bacterium]|nr:glycosyltransferase [Synergistaceae bacterium]
METPLVSVIVPVYNIEGYVRQCVGSITGQTCKNIEIILIDDGSTDGSPAVCDELSVSDTRVKVLHTPNGGLSAARNTGIEASKGDYVTFIDGDDYVSADYVLRLYELMKEYRTDISMTNYRIRHGCGEAKKAEKAEALPYVLAMNRHDAMETFLYQKHFGTMVCGKLFRKALFDGLKFPVGKIVEDMGLFYKLLDRAEKVVYSSAADYVYVQRAGSISHSQKKKFTKDYVMFAEEMKRHIAQNHPDLLAAAVSRCFSANVNCLKNIPFRELYGEEYKDVRANIARYRKSVLLNAKAPFVNRAGAALSYLGTGTLKACKALYDTLLYFLSHRYK